MTNLPKQAGTDNWKKFGLLCELDWLVSFCVSCLLTTLLLLRYLSFRSAVFAAHIIISDCVSGVKAL